jgi:uncharacterized membrane protein
MSLQKDLPELVNANIISSDTALQINEYYKRKQATQPNRQLLIFGILGAILVGTGVMFIVANQWDELSQGIKTTCAFLLLIVPQLLSGYVIQNKGDKVVWRESAALLLFFAVGANISLVSQIYNINGDTASFLLVWMLLTVPLIYLLNASALSLAYLFLSMIYCFAARAEGAYPLQEYTFWILFALPIPRYYYLFRKSPDHPLFIIHHWMIPWVLTQSLGSLSHQHQILMHPAYLFMFAIFYFIGQSPNFKNRSLLLNGYKVFGFAGTIISLLVMTFRSTWKPLIEKHPEWNTIYSAPEFIAGILLFALAAIMLYRLKKGKKLADYQLIDVTFLVFLALFLLGAWSTTTAVVLVNLLVFILGLVILREGTKLNHLGVLNTGLFVITLLVVCRSFDSDLTFFVKGSLFVLVGIGFFVANWIMIKKRTVK